MSLIAAVLIGTFLGNVVFELGFKRAYQMWAFWKLKKDLAEMTQAELSLAESAQRLAKTKRD